MFASLHAQAKLCVQTCSLDSKDALISLIRPNLAEIWACVHKHIVCIYASLRAQFKLWAQTDPACSPPWQDGSNGILNSLHTVEKN